MHDLIDVSVAMSVRSPDPGPDTRPARNRPTGTRFALQRTPATALRAAPLHSDTRATGRRRMQPRVPLCVLTDAVDRARVERRRRANHRVKPRANNDLDEHLNTSAKPPRGLHGPCCCFPRALVGSEVTAPARGAREV
jgi:hypothetical protein